MTPSPDPHPTRPLAGGLAGTMLGDRYMLDTVLGEGGMGVVYRATDTVLDRSVAVKVFREGAAERARTASETQLLASLSHPALVTLFDAQVAGGEPRYFVMEFIDGPTLQVSLSSGPLTPRTTARIARDLGEALHVVHAAGIVHRDIKPANVLLRPSNVPGEEFHAKLADFGIAYLLDSTRLTVPGTVIGSAAYLSPEQVTGASPGPASDVYSLGLVLLESLTGRRAFAQDGAPEAALARLAHDPVVPGSVGTEWAEILSDMTARDPAHRPSALDVVVRVAGIGSRSIAPSSDETVADPGGALPPRAEAGTRSDRNTKVAPRAAPEGPHQGSGSATLVLAEPGRTAPPESGELVGSAPKAVRWLVAAIAALAAAIAVVVAVMAWIPNDEPTPAPALPVVDEPLRGHLQQLMDSVSP